MLRRGFAIWRTLVARQQDETSQAAAFSFIAGTALGAKLGGGFVFIFTSAPPVAPTPVVIATDPVAQPARIPLVQPTTIAPQPARPASLASLANVPSGRSAAQPPVTSAPSRPYAYESSGDTTPTGLPVFTGPRGGRYHYSKSGKKVYEKAVPLTPGSVNRDLTAPPPTAVPPRRLAFSRVPPRVSNTRQIA